MSTNSITTYKQFKTRAKLNWLTDNPVLVKQFTYHISQYTPSVYAEIMIILDSNNFGNFKEIDKLPIKDRLVDVWFEPELYHNRLKKQCYPGPFQFCVIQYEFSQFPVTEMDLEYKNINDAKLIILKCVDPIFYSMTLDQRMTSYGKTIASSVVKNIASRNGAELQSVVDTDYAYNWLQSQCTDYEMIRSLLPYSRSSDGDMMYTFFMFNKKMTYAPISAGRKFPIRIKVDMTRNISSSYQTSDLKYLIERYGGKDTLYSFHHGYKNFEVVKPGSMSTQSYINNKTPGKQHTGIATRYVNTGFEDKTLQEIYISNLRHRIHSFSRIITLRSEAIPEITPINCVELISEKQGKTQELDGIFYVASIKYTFGMTNRHPDMPSMDLCLCSELDSFGIDSPEGKPIE